MGHAYGQFVWTEERGGPVKDLGKGVGCIVCAILIPIVCILCSVVLFFESLRQSLASNVATAPLAVMLGNWMNAPYSGVLGETDGNINNILNLSNVPVYHGCPKPDTPCPNCNFIPMRQRPMENSKLTGNRWLLTMNDFGGGFHPSNHGGVDFGLGSLNIHAIMGGAVAFDGLVDCGYGHLIVIQNGDFQFYYAHLQCGGGPSGKTCADGWRPKYKQGDIIETNEVFASAGNMGNSTGTHLHFEIRQRKNGEFMPIDPGKAMLPGFTTPCDQWESVPVDKYQ
jgi:hypothetical protein